MTEPKVTRDGTVTVDGTVRGQVVKARGFSIGAAIMGTDGPIVWTAHDTAGEPLSGREFNTRKEAVRCVVKATDAPSVSDIHEGHGWSNTDAYVAAGLAFKGAYFGVSRYPHEAEWVVDYYVAPGAFCPTFANGEGTRVTSVRILQGEPADIVTAAVKAWQESR